MAHINKVVKSVEDPNRTVCVDLFCRPDGSFGYQICRRDPEDGRGWTILGGESDLIFTDLESALAAARDRVDWL